MPYIRRGSGRGLVWRGQDPHGRGSCGGGASPGGGRLLRGCGGGRSIAWLEEGDILLLSPACLQLRHVRELRRPGASIRRPGPREGLSVAPRPVNVARAGPVAIPDAGLGKGWEPGGPYGGHPGPLHLRASYPVQRHDLPGPSGRAAGPSLRLWTRPSVVPWAWGPWWCAPGFPTPGGDPWRGRFWWRLAPSHGPHPPWNRGDSPRGSTVPVGGWLLR